MGARISPIIDVSNEIELVSVNEEYYIGLDDFIEDRNRLTCHGNQKQYSKYTQKL